MLKFATMTMQNGQPLDIPASSILFLEGLDAAGKQSNPGCRSGLFFDLGTGPQAITVQEPFNKLAVAMREGRPDPLVQVTSAHKAKVLLIAANIIGLRGLADDHPNDGKCQITHRVGPRVLPLDVLETYDEIKAAMAIPVTTSGGAEHGDETEE